MSEPETSEPETSEPETSEPEMREFADPEDEKLATLARSARARTGAAQGAALRDTEGRTYLAATVDLPSLRLAALEVAVAMAVSSGAPSLEAAVVVGGDEAGERGVAAVRDLAVSAPVHHLPR